MPVRPAGAAAALLVAVQLALPGALLLRAQPRLLGRSVHLGVAGQPEWAHFAGRTPSGPALSLDFDSTRNTTEHALLIRQADVKQTWTVSLNEVRLGTLAAMEADLVHLLAVPAGTLRDGSNTLRIAGKVNDDIVLHGIELHPEPVAALLAAASIDVTVTDERGAPLPARVTVLDDRRFLAALAGDPSARAAVRPGVAYTGGDPLRLGLLPGTYRLRATRGPEYSAGDATVRVRAGETARVRLRIRREVPTGGWAAMDTHVHTLALSGHGDATLEERALTLAGEGIDLAVATEHDRVADYGGALRAMRVDRYVTPVAGTEVTTRRGHFNVVPAARGTWAILNHPHDVHSGFTPFSRPHFHPVTGATQGLTRDFQAMEVVNSGAMRSDWMEPIRSWFALLSRTAAVTPVGASDSHDVSRFIVGQGRTYVQVDDGDPGRIDVREAVAALHESRVVVGLGLFADVSIGDAGPGHVVPAVRGRALRARVYGPSWMDADRVAVHVDGEMLHEQRITAATPPRVLKADLTWPLPRRRHDYHVVVIASGPGVTDPAWAVARPYQPSALEWTPAVFTLTAPIRVDADGDGRYSSARDYAARIVADGSSPRAIVAALGDHSATVAAHVAELLEARGEHLDDPALRDALAAAAPALRQGFDSYRAGK